MVLGRFSRECITSKPAMPNSAQDPRSAPRESDCFATTHWSAVLNARPSGEPSSSEALEILCRTYYFPLYAFVRRQGHSPEDSEDLTQEFFGRFIEKDYLASVDPAKGRFRSFLLASLKNFLSVARVRQSAIKRGGRQTFVSLDDPDLEERFLAEPATHGPPEAAYDSGWATTVMDLALHRVRTEFQHEGRSELFERLKVFLSREPAPGEYAALATAAETTAGALSVAVHRLRHRYGQYVRAEVANTVARPSEVDDELRHLFTTLTAH
jgi:RNA polymerase sigma-70 factor (ECF subfamily)